MNWLIITGLSVATISLPFILFEIGKCSVRRDLRKNIIELEKIKENSNQEITALIDIHFEELKKLDMFLKEK